MLVLGLVLGLGLCLSTEIGYLLLRLVLGLEDQVIRLGLGLMTHVLVLVLVLATRDLNLCLALNFCRFQVDYGCMTFEDATFTLIPTAAKTRNVLIINILWCNGRLFL